MIVAGLSSTAYSAVAMDGPDGDSVSNAYAQLIKAEYQLLKSELAVEAKKSASFEKLLANGHASWLENRQQKLVVDILNAKLAAYKQFESQVMPTLAGGKLKLESKFKSINSDSDELRLELIQELQKELASLRQSEEKLGHGIASLPADDSWAEGYRLRHVLTRHQADVVAAKLMLLERLNVQSDKVGESEFVSTTNPPVASTTGWKRPTKDSSSMQLLITQAELQVQLSQHHLLNETQRLASMGELSGRGMVTERSMIELKKQVDAIKELLKEQQDNLSWLKKDLEKDVVASPQTELVYTSISAPAGEENIKSTKSLATQANSPVLPSVLNQFELSQASYLKREAVLKGEMYGEVLDKLERAVTAQINQTQLNGTSTEFSNVLVRGQQRELEQYRWKIKKTELQRDLAAAQIALLGELNGSQLQVSTLLVSTTINPSYSATLPSRFQSSDPFGLQTTYSAFIYSSPRFRARRPALASRGDYSSVFRPVINRNALSFYRGLESSRFGSSFGGFNRGYYHGSSNVGFRYFRPPGVSPFQFPGSPSTFRFGGYGNSTRFNSIGRSSLIYSSAGPGYYGR